MKVFSLQKVVKIMRIVHWVTCGEGGCHGCEGMMNSGYLDP
jgi:hypothetical protein